MDWYESKGPALKRDRNETTFQHIKHLPIRHRKRHTRGRVIITYINLVVLDRHHVIQRMVLKEVIIFQEHCETCDGMARTWLKISTSFCNLLKKQTFNIPASSTNKNPRTYKIKLCPYWKVKRGSNEGARSLW